MRDYTRARTRCVTHLKRSVKCLLSLFDLLDGILGCRRRVLIVLHASANDAITHDNQCNLHRQVLSKLCWCWC
jgi:hypothetical protein